MTVREYIGARYVPVFMGAWDSTATYEPLSIVQYQGNSYTSRQHVPTGIEITNETYWAETGSYNAQVEQYRQEVLSLESNINEIESNNWVTENRIANNAVTSNKIANDSIGTDKIVDDAITSNKIADNSIGTDKIVDAAITSNKIADNSIGTDKIVDDAITSNKIADNSIGTDKIVDNSISYDKLNSDIVDNLKRLELHELNFKCIDRFIVGANDSNNQAGQAGCAFIQNNVRYYAQFILAQDTDYDKLIIRNLDSGSTVATLTGNFSHGYSISYNPSNYQLIAQNEDNKLIVFNVATISNPHVQGYIDLALYGFSTDEEYMFCWYNNDIVALNWSNKTLTFMNTEDYSTRIQNIDFDNSATPQNINYDVESNSFYIGCSEPNCIIVVDGETFTQKHVLNVNNYYGCVYIRELESGNRCNNIIYFNNYEVIDTLLVISIFECDLIKGNVSGGMNTPYIQPSGNVGVTVDYDNGALILNAFNTSFKLFGDAIKYAQSVGAYGRIFVNFASNYPYEINVLGAEIAIQKSDSVNSVNLKSISVQNGDLILKPEGITIDPTRTYISGNVTYNVGIYLYLSKFTANYDDVVNLSGTYAHPCMLVGYSSEMYMNRLSSAEVWSVLSLNSNIFSSFNENINLLVNYRSNFIHP